MVEASDFPEPDFDTRSIISIEEGTAPAGERPAASVEGVRASQHPERDPEEKPLTKHEKRTLRKTTQQLTRFRLRNSDRDPLDFVHVRVLKHVCSPTHTHNHNDR
jgi:hypothetical protein